MCICHRARCKRDFKSQDFYSSLLNTEGQMHQLSLLLFFSLQGLCDGDPFWTGQWRKEHCHPCSGYPSQGTDKIWNLYSRYNLVPNYPAGTLYCLSQEEHKNLVFFYSKKRLITQFDVMWLPWQHRGTVLFFYWETSAEHSLINLCRSRSSSWCVP